MSSVVRSEEAHRLVDVHDRGNGSAATAPSRSADRYLTDGTRDFIEIDARH